MDYKIKINIEAEVSSVFDAITNQLNEWWGKTDGSLEKLNDEFTIRFKNSYWKFRVIDFVKNINMTWLCIEGEPEFNAEWIGSEVFWTITKQENYSTVEMKHVGLNPTLDCYDICAPTWDMFISESLKNFVETGAGKPHD